MAGVVEIAEKVGVSAATVSRALRGLHHVNERTRSKIVAAAMERNDPLRPDLIPSELRAHKPNCSYRSIHFALVFC
jgi:DNA-binding LacI/PurR family transcriptional regulator